MRLDLLIAVCALLISSLGSAASWWQARLLNEQTRVLEQQLGAQVWPYVDVEIGLNGDTTSILVRNNGLGPAVIRSEAMTVDGVPSSSIVYALHKILGPHLVKRALHGHIGLSLDGDSPGAVLRPGETTTLVALASKRFAPTLMRDAGRFAFKICYCAIVPHQCWLTESSGAGDPQPRPACYENASDLMHAGASQDRVNALLNKDF